MQSLKKIVQTLIINGTLTEQPGLFFGKTGIAVFFFHYARVTDNNLFEKYGMDLIDEIQKQITVSFPVQYDTGLAGIGCGIEYLIQNNFIETNDEDILEDFDSRMYRAVMCEPYLDFSLECGLTGWGRYFIYRLRGSGQKNNKLHEAMTHISNEIAQKIVENTISENEQPDVYRFFQDLTSFPEYAGKYDNLLQICKRWKSISEPDFSKLFPYMNNLQRLYIFQNYFNIDLTEEIGKEWKNWEETDDKRLADIGLLKGWTNEGLLFLSRFHKQDISWINLL